MNFEDELIIESLKRELFFQDKIRCVAEFNSRDSIIKFVKRHAEKIMKILFPGGRVRNSAVRLGSEKEKRYENFQYRAREREMSGEFDGCNRDSKRHCSSRRFLPARSLGPCAVPNINLLVRRLAVPSIPGPGRAFIFYGFGDTRARTVASAFRRLDFVRFVRRGGKFGQVHRRARNHVRSDDN